MTDAELMQRLCSIADQGRLKVIAAYTRVPEGLLLRAVREQTLAPLAGFERDKLIEHFTKTG